ncbi:beta-1,3-galactosyl-O-glycosyl-glycoprotein beta-1,6-N-acetylglucosaminyltransferase 7-like [Artibeus jamaicensis]|uniref:beta-1,3-galactosyl-O-glycosyl-glycoprotein beta-1,6-N-acetylglucosaminyltransferase 7-like n=1 Tax=Artibeus jamaicensis TaxID=9417 RepID=UPI00235AF9A5|nr:beta-1,3-galactosyl-O-glycosyl-glycoprotein beta-1,6-N-acetylglucosaminyltransferase 7-like [Artibeus jamaicensis]
MSRLCTARPGLLLCAVVCVSALLYFRQPAREGPGAEPPSPAVVECGFYPDELCSALFEGRGAASQVAKFCRNPLGSEILERLYAPGNCSQISQGLRFISRPLSAEEGNFSLAYIVTVHEELAMFVQLLRAIYVPQNVYCIHIDERAPKKCKSAVQTLVSCFENVFIASEREKGAHPGFVRLQADLSCMEDLIRSQFQWSYVINLCEQDFPIKTNKEIIHYIRSKWNGRNITPGAIQTAKPEPTTSPSRPESAPEGSVRASPNQRFQEEPPYNLTIYFGSAYYVLTRAFVQFVLTDTRAKDMLRWSKALQSPECHYWVTLNHVEDAPGATPNAGWEGNDVRATKWRGKEGDAHDGCAGRSDRDSCVYGPADLPRLVRSPSLFASKFESSAEPLVLACLERWHRRRVLQQAEVPVEPHWHFPRQTHFRVH